MRRSCKAGKPGQYWHGAPGSLPQLEEGSVSKAAKSWFESRESYQNITLSADGGHAMSKKSDQLGMNPSTAAHRLRKMVLFELLRNQERNRCFQCGEIIKNMENLSLEHKVPWLDGDDPAGLFFDLDNVAYSHLKCNVGARRAKTGPQTDHGTFSRYSKWGCRCKPCTRANADHRQKYRGRLAE